MRRKREAHVATQKDQVVFVTGAATGIGAATARLFGKRAAAVALMDVNANQGGVTAADVQKNGARALFVEGDVSNEDDVQAALKRAVATFGRVDVLVNNAAILIRHERLEEWTVAEFSRIIAINLTSVFITTRTVAPAMARTGGGVIVNISSMGALWPVVLSPAYAAAKAGILGLTRSIAAMLETYKVRVNSVLPGLVATPMTADSRSQEVDFDGGKMQPEDLASGIAYVVDNELPSGGAYLVRNTPRGPCVYSVADIPELKEVKLSPFQ
jgi:NAD(P)-dependent dehydrogenase (short-subunit alcohol dehydrogenase family)